MSCWNCSNHNIRKILKSPTWKVTLKSPEIFMRSSRKGSSRFKKERSLRLSKRKMQLHNWRKNSIFSNSMNPPIHPTSILLLWNQKKSTNNWKIDQRQQKWISSLYCNKENRNSRICKKDHNTKGKNSNRKFPEWNNKSWIMKNTLNTLMNKGYNKKTLRKNITCLSKN